MRQIGTPTSLHTFLQLPKGIQKEIVERHIESNDFDPQTVQNARLVSKRFLQDTTATVRNKEYKRTLQMTNGVLPGKSVPTTYFSDLAINSINKKLETLYQLNPNQKIKLHMKPTLRESDDEGRDKIVQITSFSHRDGTVVFNVTDGSNYLWAVNSERIDHISLVPK
ncbi:MAG: hypothetical protein ACI9BD_000257 [Candidatus Marinamargulisbacteria bacterium]|jgi:hypothetical protein